MAILELQHLKKYYATHKAVDDISFSIPEGSIFGLLGPNGAGKTTLLRMITGIIYPDSGEIFFEGKKFNPTEDISQIGYMPEERGLYKKMKIGEQALYLAQLKGMSRRDAMKKIKEWFVKFEMESWWNKKVNDLSKGMGQKLQFVTTVLHDPKLLILDEPFSGLDPVNSNLIKDEIFKLAQKGTTIIFSTHRMEQVEEICNNIVLVNNGKKILDGTVKQIKDDFKEHVFKVGFDQLPESFSSTAFDIVDSTENSFNVKIKDGNKPPNVLQEFLNHNASIISFNEVLPSLNEIFIKVAGKKESIKNKEVAFSK
jgi:ABC-2 type transport system ATP-binding protein